MVHQALLEPLEPLVQRDHWVILDLRASLDLLDQGEILEIMVHLELLVNVEI